MAAEEVTRTKLFVNTEWTAENCPATIKLESGEEVALTWGVNAFGTMDTVTTHIKDTTTAVPGSAFEVVLQSDDIGGNTDYAFVEGADVLFSGDGKFTFRYLFRAGSKIYGQKVTIAEGTTLTASQLDATSGQLMLTGNTVDVYGTLNIGMLRIAEEASNATMNVYAGGYCSIGDFLTSGAAADGNHSINVYGDNEEFGAVQFKTTWGGYHADYSGAPSNFSFNISQYGVVEFACHVDGGSARGLDFGGNFALSLNDGKLISGAGNFLLKDTASISMVGDSEATMNSLTLNAGTSVTLEANSSLIVSGAITVADGATFTVDWSKMDQADWSKVNMVLDAGSVSGKIISNIYPPTDGSYTLVNDVEKGQIYYYDEDQLDKTKLLVTADELVGTDPVEANGTYYVAGVTAFGEGNVQAAYEIFYGSAAEDSATTITLDANENEYVLQGTITNPETDPDFKHEKNFYKLNTVIVEGKDLKFSGEGSVTSGAHGLTYVKDGTLTIDKDVTYVMGHHIWLDDNGTFDVYGALDYNEAATSNGSFIMGFKESATVNVYAGATLRTSGCSTFGYAGTINVIGDGKAVADDAQYIGTTAGNNYAIGGKTETSYGNGAFNVTEKGYASFAGNLSLGGAGGIDEAQYQTAHSTGYVTVDDGKLVVGQNLNVGFTKAYGTTNAGGYSSAGNGVMVVKNGADVTVGNLNVIDVTYNTSADTVATAESSFTIDYTSKLTYTGAITVGEGASFTVDFTGIEESGKLFALVVDGSAATGGITGDVTFTGLSADSAWKAVSGSNIYAYDTSKVDTANVVVNADWADDGLAFGATVTVGDATYLWGINAFGNFSDAIAAGAGNDAITITNANESAYSISGSLDASGFTSLTLGGAWGLASETKVYGDIVLENGASITGANYTRWQDNASVTIVGNAFLKDKYLNATEELDVTIVLTGDTDAETSRIQCNGRFQGPVAVTVTADDVKNLTAETYKIADYSKYNSANYYNYTVDSALKKAGYAIQKTADGVFLTKGEIYDVTTVVYDPSLTAENNTVEYAGKTYTLGQNAFSDITTAIATTIANYDAEKATDLVLMDDWIGTTNLSFAYSINVNIIDGTGEGVLIETSKQNGGHKDRIFDFYNWMEGVQGPSQVTIGEGVTFSSNTSETAPGGSDIATAFRMNTGVLNVDGTITHNNCSGNWFALEGTTYNTIVNVSETGKINMGCITAKELNITGDGEGFAETAQVIFSTSGQCDVHNVLITEYGTMQTKGDSNYVIGKSGNSQFVIDDGKLIAQDLQVGSAEITGTLEMIGDSELVVRDLNVVGEYGDVTIDHTAMVDYSRKITGDIAVDFSTFDATAMNESFVVIVDGRDASTGISGNIEYIGDSKLTLAGWTAVNDGKNVYIYDQAVYGKDIYVNSAWSEVGNLTAVEGTNYVIGLNAYSSIEAAAKAGATRVISMDALGGDAAYTGLYINFNVAEDDTPVIDGGAVSLDAFNANGKDIKVDQLTLNVGGEVVSRADSLVLGDGADADAALNFGEGEKLIVNTMFVTEVATITGTGLSFSGKGATLTIGEGATLTMSAAQLLNIQGVKIEGADGSIIISDLANLTVSQKDALLEEYGAIIKDLADTTVTEDAPVKTDVADLTQIEPEFEGEVTGTSAANKLVIKKGEEADYSGIDYNMRGGKNTVTINQDADFAIGDLENVSTIDVKAGSKNDKTVADFGAITAAAGNTTVKVGNNVDFSAEAIGKSDLGGTNTVSFGNNVDAEVTGGGIIAAKSVTLGKGSTLNVGGDICYDITTYSNSALKVGNDSSISAGDVAMSSVTFGKYVTATLGELSTVKTLSIGANNIVKVEAVDGTAVNGSIKSGNDSTVEIDGDVNMRGGKNSIITGKNSEWTIEGHVMNVNTLTATAAGSWAWNTGKTAYNLQRTRLSINGDFLAGEGAATLTFGNYSIVNIGGGILESDLGSTFKITVGSNAEVAVADNIQSLNSLTIANGVDYKTYSLNEAGKAVADADKAEGTTKFTAGKVTGTEKNDTIKVGNKAEVKFDKISLGDGNDTINIGKESYFEAANIELGAGKNTVIVGAESWMNVDDIKSVNKLTVTGALEAGDITGTDDFADVVTFNGVAEVGSIDLGTDAKGKMNDKLVIGKEAAVTINGTISNIETVTIGKDAIVGAKDATLIDILAFNGVKGSKIDASASFVSLDDVAGDTSSDAIYEAGFEALLGAKIEGTGDDEYLTDTADCFALGTGTDLTGWSISGEGIKVTVFKQTADGWDAGTVIEDAVGEGAVADGKFDLTDYTAEGVTGVKVAVSLDLEDGEEAAITKYSVTLA